MTQGWARPVITSESPLQAQTQTCITPGRASRGPERRQRQETGAQNPGALTIPGIFSYTSPPPQTGELAKASAQPPAQQRFLTLAGWPPAAGPPGDDGISHSSACRLGPTRMSKISRFLGSSRSQSLSGLMTPRSKEQAPPAEQKVQPTFPSVCTGHLSPGGFTLR